MKTRGEARQAISHAQGLIERGEIYQALDILRAVSHEAEDAGSRLLAAGVVLSTLLGEASEEPRPGSDEYAEISSYLELAAEHYKTSSTKDQAAFGELIDTETFRDFLNCARRGSRLMTAFAQRMAESQALYEKGDHNAALELAKRMVAESSRVRDRLFAAGLVGSIMHRHIFRGPPKPGTEAYREFEKYLTIALNAYDQADADVQEEFRSFNDVDDLRRTLSSMQRGETMERGEPTGRATGSGCFIASACYGSSSAPEVVALSRFRDEVLQASVYGRWLVRGYYAVSPRLAGFVSRSSFLRKLVLTFAIRPCVRLVSRYVGLR